MRAFFKDSHQSSVFRGLTGLIIAFIIVIRIGAGYGGNIEAKTLYVQGPAMEFTTIQAAIDAAVDGDTVVVMKSSVGPEYKGPGNTNIDFKGKAITLRSEDGTKITINCELSSVGFIFHNGETNASVLKGFTIENGITSAISSNIDVIGDIDEEYLAGGITCYYSSPTIIDCDLTDNVGVVDINYAGIGCFFSSPSITNCTIYGNTYGGVTCIGSSPNITNCTIFGNSGKHLGGIACISSSSPNIADCTIYGNEGAGIYCISSSSPNIINCPIYNNPQGIHCMDSSSPNIYQCEITENTISGIYCDFSSPSITDCIINNNDKGIIIWNCSPDITRCTINENQRDGISCCVSSPGYTPNITYCTINKNNNGIYCQNSCPHITGCTINENNVNGIYGELFYPDITNCIISRNTNHGIFCSQHSQLVIINSTLFDNDQNEIYCDHSYLTIKNCIIGDRHWWATTAIEVDWSGVQFNYSPFKIEYSNIKGFNLLENLYFPRGTGNIDQNPVFEDPEKGDFRLRYGSPCIDSGMQIETLYSDQRGSLRPLGENRADNKFDMGALEYSHYWSSIGTDKVVKAFTNIKLLAPYALISNGDTYEYEIQWNSMGSFPLNDLRVSQPHKYKVNIALVGDNRRIDLTPLNGLEFLTDISAMQPDGGYQWSHTLTFNESHLGSWNIRIEIADDPLQFALSKDTIHIISPDSLTNIIGEPVLLPEGDPNDPSDNVDTSKKPDFEEDKFLWSDVTNTLYPIADAVGTKVTWKDAYDRSIVVVYNNIWPDNPQYHIAGSPPVELLPEGSQYQTVEMVYSETNIDSLGQGGQSSFSVPAKGAIYVTGYTVLVYYELNKLKSEPNFEVIRTVLHDSTNYITLSKERKAPEIPEIYEEQRIKVYEEIDWIIGEKAEGLANVETVEITYSNENDPNENILAENIQNIHDCDCGGGYVFKENARYDAKIYNRDSREGPIFPVNKDDQGDELMVVWYQKSIYNTGVCWPYKTVYYDCNWPDQCQNCQPEDANSPGLITITSEQGDLIPYKAKSPEIYIQPDPTLPGYNPNEEHALIIGDSVFAIRCDLNNVRLDPLTNTIAKYPAGEVNYTSDAYVLLKFQDPLNNDQWDYKLYKVEAGNDILTKKAGYLIQPLYPLSTFIPWCTTKPTESYWDSNVYSQGHVWADNEPGTWWEDYKENIYARKGKEQSGSRGYLYFYYPLQDNFYYDLDQDGLLDENLGECIPFMNLYDSNDDNDLTTPPDTPPNKPHPVRYKICWPDDRECLCPDALPTEPCPELEEVPELNVGETLLEPKRGLPDISNQCGVKIIFDQGVVRYDDQGHVLEEFNDDPQYASVKLLDPLGTRAVELDNQPNFDGQELDFEGVKIRAEKNWETGKLEFPDLSAHLKKRFSYNPFKGEHGALEFKGHYDDTQMGEPLLLLNVITYRELFELLCLDSEFDEAHYDVSNLEDTSKEEFIPENLTPQGSFQSAVLDLYNECKTALDDLAGAKQVLDCGFQYCQDKFAEQDGSIYYNPSNNNDRIAPIACSKALTAGAAKGKGYVTLAFSDHECCDPNPIDLKVIKVVCPLYKGEIKVIESVNAFDEKVTFRHNGDFGGELDSRGLLFQWKFCRSDKKPLTPDFAPEEWEDWNLEHKDRQIYTLVWTCPPDNPRICPGESICTDGAFTERAYKGAVNITIEGPGIEILKDKWFSCRYTGYDTCKKDCSYEFESGSGAQPVAGKRWQWSPWTEPQLYENWIKRVMKRINLFDQRYQNFHNTEVNTFASMIKQAGERYEGPVALVDDADYLNQLGLIEGYQTVLNRGMNFSIDYGINDDSANKALLLATSRISDLYMLLGNEAYADAADPTIGFGTEDGVFGAEATSIFCFENQLDSLLEEELALLRGRDDYGYAPVYNRLVWNYTIGQLGGEVAYSMHYNLSDQDSDGDIDEYDARVIYPQGHGDAWGHYLSAIKAYYRLLGHDKYDWEPRTEYLLVAGKAVHVDYLDERKFAQAASARAKCGAEIVDLTYRYHYVEDPEKQWQGYKDDSTNKSGSINTYTEGSNNIVHKTNRAWGVSDWAGRAGQGAYLDWLVANAILPEQAIDDDYYSNPSATDLPMEGIENIDRFTVQELCAIPSYFKEIQSTLDNADIGLNPIGVAKDALPFDISPMDIIANNTTHFEQIYNRGAIALNNAVKVFNHANQFTQLLRRQQDSLKDFQDNVEVREHDFNNRLIEIFGYPYEDDKGPGGSYSEEYNGPDLYHFMYIDSLVDKTHTFSVEIIDFPEVAINEMTHLVLPEKKQIDFHLSTNLGMLVKPEAWRGRRRAPGEIQLALSELLQIKAKFDQALVNYDNLLNQIEDQRELIKAQYDLNASEITILNEAMTTQESLNETIHKAREKELDLRTYAHDAIAVARAIAESFPQVIGGIAGPSSGQVSDILAPERAFAFEGGQLSSLLYNEDADEKVLNELSDQQEKEIEQALTNIELTTAQGEFALKPQIVQLNQLVRQEASLRFEFYTLSENIRQAERRFLSTLARGERIIQDRLLFRKQTANKIQDYRYKDMAFRIFRNEALQKYRAQFDLAARYVYLAAKAYDYETALLDSYSLDGQAFLTDIVRQRSIGIIQDGLPITGTGLADVMARLDRNFNVLKGQLGFNNPQTETNRFSLRRELFRKGAGEESDNDWKQILESMYVANLSDIPEFERYCIPFSDEAQPAIVIPFSTEITCGKNFFGNELWGGDNYYPPENFATKIRSVGVWFSNYNSLYMLGMAQSPRVYLVPCGIDKQRVPSSLSIRKWQVIDQIIPVPFQLGEAYGELEEINWIPSVDTLSEELFKSRRHPRFRAYHDSGALKLEEMTYDSRLIGRSAWNTRWLLIIPGASFHYDPDEGIDTFIHGPRVLPGSEERTGYGVTDIKIFFQTYSYPGY